ncbi:MAG TPA: hypothetical protein DCS66_18350 [Flavobacteriaceae bacterium]|nr:hypothetical protein [Flavobacteriaceae bacterium]HAT66527.1 hypothetical protein [Flavobacteriaceae bacterium]
MLEKGDWVRTDAQGFYSLKCVSGSTLFVKKGDLRSQDYTLGTKNERVDFSLIPEVKTTIVTVGKIASVEITQGEIEEIVISEIAEVEEEIKEEQQDSTKVTIKGTVTDDMNMPLPGANVIIKGTSIGTQTDFDGNYEIKAEPNQTIVFSYLGFIDKEILVSNISNNVDVKMDAYYLGGLVGYVIVSEVSEQVVVDPYQSNSYYDEEQRENREKRRAYAEKENAFKKVKADRKKAARLLKRSQKKDK